MRLARPLLPWLPTTFDASARCHHAVDEVLVEDRFNASTITLAQPPGVAELITIHDFHGHKFAEAASCERYCVASHIP